MSLGRSDIIRAIFAAYRVSDRSAVEAVLADDFRFTSPYDDALDKATYFERCWDTGWIEQQDIDKIFVEGDEAFVTYQCVARGGKSFRDTEFFRFEGDRVKSIEVYFGAAYQGGVFVRQPK
jgi:ketosteroid isomerase-like protein